MSELLASQLDPFGTAVVFHLGDGSIARKVYQIPPEIDDATYVRAQLLQAIQGGATISVQSLNTNTIGDIEIMASAICAFIVNP